MFSRLNRTEQVVGGAAALGVIASFFTWYSYGVGASDIKVNGFRSSVLGDMYFIAAAFLLAQVASRARLISIPRLPEWAWTGAATFCAATACIQFLTVLVVGKSIHLALLAAVASGIAMAWATRQGREQSNLSQGFSRRS